MKTEKFGRKYWLLSCGVGFALFLLISFLSDNASLAPIAKVLLWPGAEIADLAGFGGHDIQGFFLYIFGNAALYCAIFLILFRFLKIGAISSREQ
jgi:hypothetical protein